ncbi:MAG TPA: Gfo/Idh/MocA family oxidoreductase [Terrimicrobiaceae bacterium]|nr:Gfo/Idh/MocA family oxidoreductase [Terrimicrobiaceae bacterium]
MSQRHRIAFAGLRHPHIFALHSRAQAHPECEVVAACEEDTVLREKLSTEHDIRLTHSNFMEMLEESNASIVAVGDIYARRGELAIAALRAGKHVILDKPICTRLEELEEIRALAADRQLAVGCQLDFVENGGIRCLKSVIEGGEIGRLCTLAISAQHPLRLESRAGWYFEPGQHGGTINDIGVHVFDLVPWLSGQPWKQILLAREWNAKAATFPHFKDCAQFNAITTDGLSCYADVSYLAPDTLGYELPQYWRVTAHGTKGLAEMSYGISGVQIATDRDAAVRKIFVSENTSSCYLQDFLDEISGHPSQVGLTTMRVLSASRWALEAQVIASRKS